MAAGGPCWAPQPQQPALEERTASRLAGPSTQQSEWELLEGFWETKKRNHTYSADFDLTVRKTVMCALWARDSSAVRWGKEQPRGSGCLGKRSTLATKPARLFSSSPHPPHLFESGTSRRQGLLVFAHHPVHLGRQPPTPCFVLSAAAQPSPPACFDVHLASTVGSGGSYGGLPPGRDSARPLAVNHPCHHPWVAPAAHRGGLESRTGDHDWRAGGGPDVVVAAAAGGGTRRRWWPRRRCATRRCFCGGVAVATDCDDGRARDRRRG